MKKTKFKTKQVENMEYRLYHVFYLLKKLKKHTLNLEFDNLDNNDF